MTTTEQTALATAAEVAATLWQPDEVIALCYKTRGGLQATMTHASGFQEKLATLPRGADQWVSMNPLQGDMLHVTRRRGTAEDVSRLAALYADIDIKPDGGGMPDRDTALALIHVLSDLIGAPAFVVASGHGFQPIWPITDFQISTFDDRDRAKLLLQKWGEVVKSHATRLGGAADSVFDLPRILRITPGSYNHKDLHDGKGDPIPVEVSRIPHTRMTADEAQARVDAAHAACEPTPAKHLPTRPAPTPVTPTPAVDGLVMGESLGACSYVNTAVHGWATDHPNGNRHNWLIAKAIKLGAFSAYGCLPPEGEDRAAGILDARFMELLNNPRLGGTRAPTHNEVDAAVAEGRKRAAAMRPAELAEEVGHHHGGDLFDDDDEEVTPTAVASLFTAEATPTEVATPTAGAVSSGTGNDTPEAGRKFPRPLSFQEHELFGGLVLAPDDHDYEDSELYPLGHPAAPDLIKDVFDANDWMRSVYWHAMESGEATSPFAVLKFVLHRVGLHSSCNTRVNGAPLSQFDVVLAPSGGGKGSAHACARLFPLQWTEPPPGPGDGPDLLSIHSEAETTTAIASGEAIKLLFVTKTKGEGGRGWYYSTVANAVRAIHFDEMATLLKKGAANSSVLFDLLNTTWSGAVGALDARAVSDEGSLRVEGFYAAYLQTGLQPIHWAKLASEIGGFLQRCTFAGTTHPWHLTPRALDVARPTVGYKPPVIPWLTKTAGAFGGAVAFEMELPHSLERDIELARAQRAMAPRGGTDSWDTHLLQNTMRCAASLSLAWGLDYVSEDAYRIARRLVGDVDSHSNRIRAETMVRSRRLELMAEEEAGADVGARRLSERGYQHGEARKMRTAIISGLTRAGGEMPRRELKRRYGRSSPAAGLLFDEAITALTNGGKILELRVKPTGGGAPSTVCKLSDS